MRLLGIDLGGTNIKAGLCDGRGRVIRSDSTPTEAERGPAHVVRRMIDLARRFGRADAVGIGVPGPLDADRRRVQTFINLPGWKNVPLPRMMSKELKRPVFMENDANCAGVGEALLGAGRGYPAVALFTLGTGVGGALVFGGRLWTGTGGGAGELGHIVVDPRGPKCGCGSRGCVEQYASATAVVRRYRALTGRALTAREIFSRRDPAARKAIAEVAGGLAAAISILLYTLHPDLFILSGGMAAGGSRLLPLVKAAVRPRVLPLYWGRFRMALGTLGDDAGWLGAALVARDRLAR